MTETKYTLSLPLAIAIGVMIVTAASAGSALAAGNTSNASGATAGNMTKAGGATAGNVSAAAKNATSSNSSNPVAKLGQAISKGLGSIFGGKK